MSPASEFSWYL